MSRSSRFEIQVGRCRSSTPVINPIKKRCLTTTELNKIPMCCPFLCPGSDTNTPSCICVQQTPVIVSKKNVVWVQKCVREPSVVNTTKTVMMPKVIKVARAVHIPEVTWTEGVVARPRIEYKTEERTENEVKNYEKTIWSPQEICTMYLCRPKPQKIFIPPPTDYCCYSLNALNQLPWGNQCSPCPPNNCLGENMGPIGGNMGSSQCTEPSWPCYEGNMGSSQCIEPSWPCYGGNVGSSQCYEPSWPCYGGNVGSSQCNEPSWPWYGGNSQCTEPSWPWYGGNMGSPQCTEPSWPCYGGNMRSSQCTETSWPCYGGKTGNSQCIEPSWACHRGNSGNHGNSQYFCDPVWPGHRGSMPGISSC